MPDRPDPADHTAALTPAARAARAATRGTGPSDEARRALTVVVGHHLTPTRQGIAAALAGEDIGVHEASDGPTAFGLVRDVVPDVAVLSVDLPGIGGLSLCQALRDELPACAVLLISSPDDARLGKGLAAGAAGAVAGTPSTGWPATVRMAARRGALPSAAGARWLRGRASRLAIELPEPEREVIDLFADGLRPDVIAERLERTPASVARLAGNALARVQRPVEGLDDAGDDDWIVEDDDED